MAVVTLTGNYADPLGACKFAVLHGDRTYNMGTAYNFFKQYFTTYSLKYSETKDLDTALKALDNPAHLVVASVGPGYWTHTGHYILLFAHKDNYIYARDPLHPNRNRTTKDSLKKEGLIYFIVSQ